LLPKSARGGHRQVRRTRRAVMEEQDGVVSRVCGGTQDRRHEREEVVNRFYNVRIGTTPVGMKMERERM
jgi:hypothetical protein